MLDVDGAQGEKSLIDLAQRGFMLPDTYTVRTGSGGQHIYFAWPEGGDEVVTARARSVPVWTFAVLADSWPLHLRCTRAGGAMK